MARRTAFAVLAILLVSCTSAWERHRQLVDDHRAAGDVGSAAAAQKWLVENAFLHAPEAERGPEHDADRLLVLADLLAGAGQVRPAIELYREVLRLDRTRAEDVLTGIGLLPIPPDLRNAYLDEFARTALSLDPGARIGRQPGQACWSYGAREIRVRSIWTTKGPDSLERHARYDARRWSYDAGRDIWQPDAEWVRDAGAEIQPVAGAANPRYTAILDADGGFLADVAIPPCHQPEWHGPYDTRWGTIFTAPELPGTAP